MPSTEPTGFRLFGQGTLEPVPAARPYAAGVSQSGISYEAGTSYKIKIHYPGAVVSFRATPESWEAAKALPVGTLVNLTLDFAYGRVTVIGIERAKS